MMGLRGALAGVLLLAAAGTTLPVRAAELAFVLNSAEASVSVLDVNTQTELRRIPVLREPHHLALTPDRRFLLIGDTTGNELLSLDPATGEVRRRLPMSDPYQLVFSPDGKWLTVAALARNQVDIYDAASFKLAYRLLASSMPSHINYAPDSSMVFISLQGSDSLLAIEVKTGRVVWKAKVGSTPAGVLWHNDKLLVGIMGDDYVAVVDPVDGHVERKVRTGRGAHVMFVPHDGRVIYVSNRVDGSITTLDAETLTPIRTFAIPGGPDDMDFAPDGKAWISMRFSHEIAIADPATGTYQIVRVGRSPHGIWLNTHDVLPTALAASGDQH